MSRSAQPVFAALLVTALMGLWLATPAHAIDTAKGKIVSVADDGESFEISVDDDNTITVSVNDETTYQVNGEEAEKADVLEVGAVVQVMHEDGVASNVNRRKE